MRRARSNLPEGLAPRIRFDVLMRFFRASACSRACGPLLLCGTAQIRTGFMRVLLHVIDFALAIYIWLLLARAVLSWLIEFKAVDGRRRVVALIGVWLSCVTEPALRLIRPFLPGLGGLDISPVVAIVMMATIRYVIALFILPKLL
jgi:YggT family protein